jgi:hypothetical protein
MSILNQGARYISFFKYTIDNLILLLFFCETFRSGLTYHVFEFTLGELSDGSIGIILEANKTFEEEPAEF